MKTFKIALAASSALLWTTVAAHAMPTLTFAIGSLVLSAGLAVPGGTAILSLFGAASAASIGSTVLSLAITAASIAGQFLSKPNLPRPEAIKNTAAGETGPGRHAFGRVILGSRIAYGRTSDRTLHRLGLMCFGELDGIEEWYVNGIPVVVETGGEVSSPPWAKPNGSYLEIKNKVGDGTETAWADLISFYPTEWTSDHRARGIAQFLAQANSPGVQSARFAKRFQRGFPQVTALARVGQFYDPRSTTTNWTLNSALIALHYFRQVSGYSDSQIDFGRCGDAADWCDETVSVLGGTDARSRISGGWEGVLNTDKVLAMLEGGGLHVRTADDGRAYFEGIEDNPDAELTFPWEHVLEWEMQDGPEGVERPNICRVKYFSPESLYTVEEIPGVPELPWARVEDEITANGEKERVIELPFCCDASQAQRIARRIFHMDRAPVLVIKTSLAGIALDRLYCVNVEIDGLGENGGIGTLKCILDDLVINNGDGTCEAVFRVIPDILKTAFNPATDEAQAPPTVLPGTYDSEVATPDAPDAATVVQYPISGDYETRVTFDGVAGGTIAEAVYQTYTDGELDAPQSLAEAEIIDGDTGADARWLAYETDLNLLGEKVRWRVRLFDVNEDGSNLSDEFIVASMATDNTAPSAPTVTATYVSGNWDVDYTVPQEIQIVAIKFQTRLGAGSWNDASTIDVRPGASATGISVTAEGGAPPFTTEIRAVCLTTDGTEGTASAVSSHFESI
ncbi:hypothetical protein ACLB6G_20310 [Zhengella sp. ZM62]|uniref:hypothetical protein n=1 Tax=Zhengella sedimenti TaxID=3390035 RepID=UPI003974C92D